MNDFIKNHPTLTATALLAAAALLMILGWLLNDPLPILLAIILGVIVFRFTSKNIGSHGVK